MNSSVTKTVKALFEEYEDHSNRLSFDEVVKLYGRHLMAAGPAGVAIYRNNFFTRRWVAWAMKRFYKKVKMTSTKLVSLEESVITAEFSMVKVQWASTFEKTGDEPVRYCISYLVRRNHDRAEIILFISHDDEQTVLRQLGLLK
jgi:hypothetical protein